MTSCKKITELIEKSRFTKLSMREVISLKMHLAMCTKCKSFKKFSDQLETLLSNHFGQYEESTKIELGWTSDEKDQLIRKLKSL